jgi:thioredoxin 2
MEIIKFYADWCGPCKVYAPIFEKVTSDLNVEYKNINVDKDTEGLAAEYKIRSIPATVIVKEDGTVIKEVGLLQEDKLTTLIKENA